MDYKNYSISLGKGQFYEKSSTKKDGFEEVTYNTDGKDKITYHKYQKSVRGTLSNVETKEVEFQGRKLNFFEVSLKDGDAINKISTGLKNTKGNFTDEVKALISALENANKTDVYNVSISKKESEGKNGKTYTNLSFYFNIEGSAEEGGKDKSTGFIPYAEIPAPEKDEDEDLGVSWDWKPVNKFYAQKIKVAIEKFGYKGDSKKEEPPKSETKSVKKEADKKNDKPTETSDLPF